MVAQWRFLVNLTVAILIKSAVQLLHLSEPAVVAVLASSMCSVSRLLMVFHRGEGGRGRERDGDGEPEKRNNRREE